MNKKGFTLVELTTALGILAIVLLIAVPTVFVVYKEIKNKALEEKIEIIEEAAVLFGDAQKDKVVKSTYVYKDTMPCMSIKISELVSTYLENECKGDNKDEVCVIDPRNKNNYLNDIEVIVYFHNKRINAIADVNDKLECENTKNEIIIKDFYLEDGITEYVNKQDVNATITWENEKVRYYCITEKDDSNNCKWKETSGKSVTAKYTLSENDGEKTVYAFLKDKFGNISPSKIDNIILDTLSPVENSIEINDGDEYTTNKDVTLTLTSIGATKMCISNTDNCDNWEEYSLSKEWSLPTGDGEKNVYAWYKDDTGNTTEYVMDTIILDMEKPTGDIVINNDETYTTSVNVKLTLSSTGANEMCISNSSNCNNWETYATQKDWTLTDKNEKKTVYVWYRDVAGNLSDQATDTINLDTDPPKSNSVIINNNDTYTTSVDVKLTLSSSGATKMCISNTTSCSNWEAYTEAKDWKLTNKNGKKTVYVIYKDAAGNESEQVNDTIKLDTTKPTDNNIKINNNEAYTTSKDVTLTLSATGANKMCISNTKSCSKWETYATQKDWALTDGDGTKTVYVIYKDAAGNESEQVNDTIKLDTTKPTGSIKINNNDKYTTSKDVTLTLSATGANKMCISNTKSCSNWETYAATKEWTLTDGDGTKTVYVIYKDSAGNESEQVNDTIKLDTTKPTGSIKINNNEAYTTSKDVTLTLSATGANKMCISNTKSCSAWETYATTKSWALTNNDGTKTVYVRYKDAAGNLSEQVNDTIKLDATKPTVSASIVNNNSLSPKIKFTSNETGKYCINTSNTRTNMDNCLFSGSTTADSAKTTSKVAYTKKYYVHVKDAAGNIGISSGLSITVAGTFGKYLYNNPSDGLNVNTSYAGMYRYRGETVDNYVKLGNVLYRVIGVTSEANSTIGLEKYQVKLISADSIGKYAWSYDSSTKDSWTKSKIFNYLQGTNVLGNSKIIPSSWVNKIDSVKWYTGYAFDSEQYSYNTKISKILSNIKRNVSSDYSKISLMYSHDWCLANNLSMSSYCDDDDLKYNWMIPSSCKKSSSNCYIYTMTKTVSNPDWNDDCDYIDTIYSANGNSAYLVGICPGNNAKTIFPTFYLLASVVYKSGSGTSTDPFIIE